MTAQAFSPAERRDRLRLARSPGVGPVTFQYLMSRYRDASRAIAALPELARRGGENDPLRVVSAEDAERELARGEALGAHLICLGESDYPPLLAALDPPPPVIWARGHSELLARPCVAVVGARVASASGQRFARSLASDLGQAGFVVVSGLARGIDAAAHEGALATGTAAVLGGGIDDIYPSEHASLYGRIAQVGCIVSESAVGHTARAQDFPRRNRIISGLSLAVVVVEAEMRSGSLITARLANEQGRDVFAVPGSPLEPRAKGTNDLLRNGAQFCESAEDVISQLSGRTHLREPSAPVFDGDYGEEEPGFAELRDRVAALLSPTPVPRDELVRATGAPAQAVYAALMELAIAGRAELGPGGMVSLP